MIKHILVADDERGTALLLSRRLEKCGYRVTVVGDGVEAIEFLNTNKVDLLITDVVMPRMDGVDLYMELKDRPDTMDMPVIIMTDKEVFQESFAALGVELFSPKPSNFDSLLEKIKKVEQKVTENRRYNKVVVIGQKVDVLEEMRQQLLTCDCIVATVSSIIEIGLRCFLVNPRIVFLDVFTHDYATTQEIVKSLRAYAFFKNTVILLYSTEASEEAGKGPQMSAMDVAIKDCLDAGATRYIGRFYSANFLAQLKDFGVSK